MVEETTNVMIYTRTKTRSPMGVDYNMVEIDKWLKEHPEVNVVGNFHDEGTDRTGGYEDLIRTITTARKKPDYVLVHSLDSFSNDPIVVVRSMNEIKTRGVGLQAVTENVEKYRLKFQEYGEEAPGINVIIYARESTPQQDYSVQIDCSLVYIEKYNQGKPDNERMNVVKIFGDHFTSTTMDRPGLNELIEYVESFSNSEHRIQYVLIQTPDRLTRIYDDWFKFLEWADSMGLKIIFTMSSDMHNAETEKGRQDIAEYIVYSNVVRETNLLNVRINHYVRKNGIVDEGLPPCELVRADDYITYLDFATRGYSKTKVCEMYGISIGRATEVLSDPTIGYQYRVCLYNGIYKKAFEYGIIDELKCYDPKTNRVDVLMRRE